MTWTHCGKRSYWFFVYLIPVLWLAEMHDGIVDEARDIRPNHKVAEGHWHALPWYGVQVEVSAAIVVEQEHSWVSGDRCLPIVCNPQQQKRTYLSTSLSCSNLNSAVRFPDLQSRSTAVPLRQTILFLNWLSYKVTGTLSCAYFPKSSLTKVRFGISIKCSESLSIRDLVSTKTNTWRVFQPGPKRETEKAVVEILSLLSGFLMAALSKAHWKTRRVIALEAPYWRSVDFVPTKQHQASSGWPLPLFDWASPQQILTIGEQGSNA